MGPHLLLVDEDGSMQDSDLEFHTDLTEVDMEDILRMEFIWESQTTS